MRTIKEGHTAHIGMRQIWGGEQPFGLRRADRRQHVYLVGKTGSGKSTLLKNLLLQDIEAGEGVALLDPHGDLAEELLDFVPPWRADDVVYFNPADREFPIGLNLLRSASPETRHLAASGIVGAFKSIWRDSWGPRLEYILYAATAALLECENTTILGIQRMLSDARYRDWVVKQVKDPVVRSFWLDEFAGYDPKFLREAVAPIQNKVGQILMGPLLPVIGQVRSGFDPAFMMDRRRILIANLAKGRLGEDKSNLLGALLVTQFQLAAMARVAVPEDERVDFALVADEFHNFTTDAFASILSEARKYRLCLTLSHQYTAQLRDEVRDAVFGNVGTLIAFRVGESDARLLEREFGGGYTARHFADLPNYEICVKPLVEGASGDPFLARTLPPSARRYGRRDAVIRRSRERYGSRRAVVEDKIRRWMRA